jgi:hypothetical protein
MNAKSKNGSRLYQKDLKMSLKRELSEELRRLFIAHAMIGGFIFNVARTNLLADEVDSLFEEVNAAMRELEDSGIFSHNGVFDRYLIDDRETKKISRQSD